MAADALVREALDQHSTDNITCVVVYLDWQRTTRASSSDSSDLDRDPRHRTHANKYDTTRHAHDTQEQRDRLRAST